MGVGTWIKLYRRILAWEWFRDGNMLKVFLYLIMAAKVQDVRTEGRIIRRGQLEMTLKTLCAETGLTQRQARTCLSRLKNSGEILLKTTNARTLATVCHYDTYQNENTLFEAEETNERQTNDKRTTNATSYRREYREYREINTEQNKGLILGVSEEIDYEGIKERYNREFAGVLPRCIRISRERREKIRTCIAQNGRGSLDIMFANLKRMPFYLGKNRTGFTADFSFIFEPENFLKICEGPKRQDANSGIRIRTAEEMRLERVKRNTAEKERTEAMIHYAEEHPESTQAKIVEQWRKNSLI